jgi:hypothetical protein
VSIELLAPIIFLAIAIAIVRAVGVYIAMPKSKAPRQYPSANRPAAGSTQTNPATPSEPTP